MSQGIRALHNDSRSVVTAGADGDRTIIFLTNRPLISASLVRAVENEFPLMAVREMTSMQTACIRSSNQVAAIFVDMEKAGELRLWLKRLMQAHPTAPIALLQTDHRQSGALPEVIHSPGICGILPMHLKLDVWLAVIRLILSGGEYLPMSMLRSASEGSSWAASQPSQPSRSDADEDLYSLTERELQILDLVARGQQNKVIAASLQLSEHTVKIHLHNIITKLGTTNRTQAAAIYHRQRSSDGDHRGGVTRGR